MLAFVVDDLLYFVNRGGIATCLEAKTGKEIWKERLLSLIHI